jgi:hypothetical protein
MDAALALRYVVDPAAVASLVRVLEHGTLVEEYAIAGLGRIGNPSPPSGWVEDFTSKLLDMPSTPLSRSAVESETG